jgi:aldehyde dehydrogenase (NAD+)
VTAHLIPPPEYCGFLDGRPKRLLIEGSWVDAGSGEVLECHNPATGEVIAKIADGTTGDVDRAVAAARAALKASWSRWTPYDRQRALLRLADLVESNYEELGLLDTLDMGAPWSRTRMSNRNVSLLHWFAAQAVNLRGETIPNSLPGGHFSYTTREPVGVVGAIIPWNAPITSVIWKIGPVLATGCTVVLKPAEEASLSSLRFAELILEAGFPPGVVNVVTGRGPVVGAALAGHPDVDKISFTGSTSTGQEIVRASAGNMKRLTLELGGKSPNVLFDDADLELAIAGAASAIFVNAGQVCSAGSRLYVQQSIHDEVIDGISRIAAGIRVGNGLDPAVEMGPLVSSGQRDRVVGYLELGQSEGATMVTGGELASDPNLDGGYFVRPTVFTDVNGGMRISREEIFGPVVVATPFDDIDHVIALSNATPFGLASGVWTRDIGRAQAMARALQAGTVWINSWQAMDPAVPFGGWKLSGYGRESGTEQLDAYLNTKTIWVRS